MRLSVIMPVYNEEKSLKEAIESILNQTFKNFEFLIFDDGSTDSTYKICLDYLGEDSRVKVYKGTNNLGPAIVLNRMIEMTKGEYIARQDGDDTSLLTRLEKQVKYLDEHKDVMVLGTSCYKNDKEWILPEVIDNKIYEDNCVVHGSVMVRKEVFEKIGKYDESLRMCQDWELWARICCRGYLIRNLQEPLYRLTWSATTTGGHLCYAAKVREIIKERNGVEDKKKVIKVRIDDYPQGTPFKSLSSEEHMKVLGILEERKIDYYLGVVPKLVNQADIKFLSKLKHAHICIHGYDHGFSNWHIQNEFIGKSKQLVVDQIDEALLILKDFLPIKGFIPPFNKVTQNLLDVLNRFGFEFVTGGPETDLSRLNFGNLKYYPSLDQFYTSRENVYSVLNKLKDLPESQLLTMHLADALTEVFGVKIEENGYYSTRVGYIEDKVSTEVLLIDMEVGNGMSLHYHEWMTEVILFKTYAYLQVDDELYQRAPGDLVIVRPFQKHKIEARNEDARFVIVRYPFTKDDTKEAR